MNSAPYIAERFEITTLNLNSIPLDGGIELLPSPSERFRFILKLTEVTILIHKKGISHGIRR